MSGSRQQSHQGAWQRRYVIAQSAPQVQLTQAGNGMLQGDPSAAAQQQHASDSDSCDGQEQIAHGRQGDQHCCKHPNKGICQCAEWKRLRLTAHTLGVKPMMAYEGSELKFCTQCFVELALLKGCILYRGCRCIRFFFHTVR